MSDTGISLLNSIASSEAGLLDYGKDHSQRHHDDYSTPEHYIEKVRTVFGGTIGCDPASTAEDNRIIRASTFYDLEHNGLDGRNFWVSPIYLNPPSIRRDEFLKRAADEAKFGSEMIVCLNLKHLCAGYTQALLQHVSAFHMPRGRPAFVHPMTRQHSESPTDGRIFLYVGPNPDRFVGVFRHDKGWATFCMLLSDQHRRRRSFDARSGCPNENIIF